MVTVAVRTDGMPIGVSPLVVTVTIDRGRRVRGFDFDSAGRCIDSRYQNEDGDEQRKQRRHQSKSAVQLHHPGRVTHDEAERPYLRSR